MFDGVIIDMKVLIFTQGVMAFPHFTEREWATVPVCSKVRSEKCARFGMLWKDCCAAKEVKPH